MFTKTPENTSKTESTHNFSSQTLQSFIMNDQSVYIERLTFSRFTNTSASTTTWIATHYVVWAKFRILRTIFLKLSNIRFSERMHLAILTIKCIFMLKERHFYQEPQRLLLRPQRTHMQKQILMRLWLMLPHCHSDHIVLHKLIICRIIQLCMDDFFATIACFRLSKYTHEMLKSRIHI